MIILQVQRARTETEPQEKIEPGGQKKVIKKQPHHPPSHPTPIYVIFVSNLSSVCIFMWSLTASKFIPSLLSQGRFQTYLISNRISDSQDGVRLALFRSDVIHFGPISYGQRANSDDINMANQGSHFHVFRRDIQTWMVSPTWSLIPSLFPIPLPPFLALQWKGGLPLFTYPKASLLSLPPHFSFTFTYFCHRCF